MLVRRFSLAAAFVARLLIVLAVLWAVGPDPRSEPIAHWLSLGDTAADADRYDAALSAYQRVWELGGSPTLIYERLARLHLDAGRYSDAEVYLYALADLDGWTPERRDDLRVILEQRGDTARATALLFAAGAGDLQVLRRLVEHQIASLDWEQAEITLGRLLALDPGDPQALYQLALLLAPINQDYARGYLGRVAHDPDRAGRALTVLAALDGYGVYALTNAHTRLGVALAGLGEWPFAEHALNSALEVNMINPTALAYRGFVRDQQGRDGLPDLEAALAMAPNDPVIYYLLGQHWRQVGAYEREYDAFSHAYWLDPENPALAVEVALALQNQGDWAGAEEWFGRALELDPVNMRWRGAMAAFYADTGFELETTGLIFIQDTAQRAPNDPNIRASLGWAYYLTNDSARAYDELSAAVGLDPSDPRSRYYFGMVLERRGDTQGAADSYWFVVDTVGSESGFGLLAARGLQRLGYAS